MNVTEAFETLQNRITDLEARLSKRTGEYLDQRDRLRAVTAEANGYVVVFDRHVFGPFATSTEAAEFLETEQRETGGLAPTWADRRVVALTKE